MKIKILGILICIFILGAGVTQSDNISINNLQNDGDFLEIKATTIVNSEGILPEIEWIKTFGDLGNEIGRGVQQTTDGGYICIGETESYGNGGKDLWLIKTNETGNESWNKTYGGSLDDDGRYVSLCSDGGYILSGSSVSLNPGAGDAWILKVNSAGNLDCQQHYGTSAYADWGHCIIQTNDDGYAMAGVIRWYDGGQWKSHDVWLIKLDVNCNFEWNTVWGGTKRDIAYSIIQTNDNGYALGGMTESYGSGDFDGLLIKTDKNGSIEWTKTYGGPGIDRFNCVLGTSDNGYILLGYATSFGLGDFDVWLLKTDENGNEEWNKTYGGFNYDGARNFVQTEDNGYILVGGTNSTMDGDMDISILKTDVNGNEKWNMTIGGPCYDYGRSIRQTSDGGFIITGQTNGTVNGDNDLILIKIAPENIPQPNLECNGELIWKKAKPLSTKTGSFTVENIGDLESMLDWEIVEWPEWGEWTFTPISGNDLTPEDGKITVNVSLIPPKLMTFGYEEEFNRGYTGEVKIVNTENSSDYCTIPVYLRTQRNKVIYSPFIQFLQDHPNLFPLLQKLILSFGL